MSGGMKFSKKSPLAAFLLLGVVIWCGGCHGPGYAQPDWTWAPGAGARIDPPVTGRGAYGTPDPYYQNSPAPNQNGARLRDNDREFVRDDRDFDDRYGDERMRDDRVTPADYEDRGAWKSSGAERSGGSLQLRGMPKSGEPRRLRINNDLTELTDLPRSNFGSRQPRSGASISASSPPLSRRKRTPSDSFDRQYDEDYERTASNPGRWRPRVN